MSRLAAALARAPRRRLTVDEYHTMGYVGILHEDDRVELIEGELIEMAPIGHRHVATVGRVGSWFTVQLARMACVLSQSPVRLSRHSEPQPDVLILRYREDFYEDALPVPDDVLLIVEVSDTSIGYDRSVKLPMYAAAGIQEVWIVDLQRRHVTAYREPGADGYQVQVRHTRGATLSPLAFPDLYIRWNEIFVR